MDLYCRHKYILGSTSKGITWEPDMYINDYSISGQGPNVADTFLVENYNNFSDNSFTKEGLASGLGRSPSKDII